MSPTGVSKTGIVVGRILSVLIVTGAIVLALIVIYHVNYYPRTDDCEILANFIGIAPQVEGRLVHLNVHDNQFVKKGDLLFEIDDRPYRYALEKAISDQATLEGQISDERRRIAAQVSAVSAAAANIYSSEADVSRWAAVDQSRAEVSNAEDAVSRAKAEWMYASNNLHRVEPAAGEAVCHRRSGG
jgi:multidrug efflux system membrane fusion protein